MVSITFSQYMKRREFVTISIKKALHAFKLGRRVSNVVLRIDKRLKDDIEVDYSKLRRKEVTISFGSEKSITTQSIFHELGHVWDAVYNGLDFSMIKLNRRQQILGGLIINLSLDGRLEKMGLPIHSKSQRIKDFKDINERFGVCLDSDSFKKLWGIKLTKRKLMLMIKELGG